jgi:hypothetical protein
VVGDLGDHDLEVVGLPDGGLDFLDLEQFAGPGRSGEMGADGLPAGEFGRPAGRGERVGEHAVGGEQVGEDHRLAGHHLSHELGDFAWRTGHERSSVARIGTMAPLRLYGTIAPVSNHA